MIHIYTSSDHKFVPDRTVEPCELCGSTSLVWLRTKTSERINRRIVWRMEAFCSNSDVPMLRSESPSTPGASFFESGKRVHVRLIIPRMFLPQMPRAKFK